MGDSDFSREGKRQKREDAAMQVEEHLRCPITHKLPVDPVMASDGHIYERRAIQKWLDQSKKSPVTNQKFSSELQPATQVGGFILDMVTRGLLDKDTIDEWNYRRSEIERESEMVKRAHDAVEKGDRVVAYNLGRWYAWGSYGLATDNTKAFELFRKAFVLGHTSAGSRMGLSLLRGQGCEKSVPSALVCFGSAAERGSMAACLLLHKVYSHGWYGVTKDCALADFYAQKSKEASVKDATEKSLSRTFGD